MKRRFLKLFTMWFKICFAAMVVLATVTLLTGEHKVAAYEYAFCGVIFIVFLIMSSRYSKELTRFIEETMTDIHDSNKDSIIHFPMATAVIKLETNEVVWGNAAFEEMIGEHSAIFEKKLFDLIPEFNLGWVIDGGNECPHEVEINGKFYRVYGSFFDGGRTQGGFELVTLYWLDVSEYSNAITEFENSRQMVSVIMIDNYEDIMNGLNDSERSTVTAEIDKKLAEWTASAGGIFVKYEKDRSIYLFEERYLEEYTSSRFAILDSIREIESKNGMHVTLSIGIGKDGQGFGENLRNARLAIDMALSRGGDQAVIRNKFNFEFFGGRTKELEKRTKVKSRVMANALTGLIKESSGVMVMGHKNADNDSVGAAVGIVCLARKMNKKASIVIGEKTSADSLVLKLKNSEEYKDAFITEEEAIINADNDTLLVVVDTNRKVVVESQALLESANKVAVIDHHRRGTEYIEGAVLNFHEPYASSACELVTELLQYIIESRDVLQIEAEALLSGIVIDTKKFTMKTGARTFEAAAYLRRAGADTVELKRILQDDIETYVQRAELVKLAKMYKEKIAIVVYEGTSTRITAAQAADELLSIRGVGASFVLYKEQGSVIISARSLGEINVQVILEKLGGGGHFDTAGAQVRDRELDDVANELKSVIDDLVN